MFWLRNKKISFFVHTVNLRLDKLYLLSLLTDYQDAYDWQIVPTDEGCNTTSQNISLPAHKLASDLKFGVSVSMNGISGGTLWEHCRFDALYQGKVLNI